MILLLREGLPQSWPLPPRLPERPRCTDRLVTLVTLVIVVAAGVAFAGLLAGLVSLLVP